MERAAPLKYLRSLVWLSGLCALGAMAYSCAATGVRPPMSRQPAMVVSSPTPAGASGAPVAAPEPLSLDGFRPLLSEPRYEAARLALEAGDSLAAAELVQASQATDAPAASALDRHRFLLARLWERAGRSLAARDAFLAVSPVSPLAAYAELGAGRMELLLGSPERALAHVGRAGEGLPERAGRRRLLADAALRSGARAIALREYRALLESAQGARERASLAQVLLSALGAGEAPLPAEEVAEGLELSRLLLALAEDDPSLRDGARQEERRWLALSPAQAGRAPSLPSRAQQLTRLRALLEARRLEQAEGLSTSLSAFDPAESEPEACELELLRAKLASAAKRSSDAEATYLSVARSHCANDLRARALYAAGRAAQAGGRHSVAVRLYDELERSFPTQSVADDARLHGALSSLELGDEARFTDALSAMPDDYPDGDMLAEGCFRLALRRMERGDFASAERPLARAVESLPPLELGRGGDFAGRERYFLARVQQRTGELERGLRGYERLIQELPLGYYVRAAYTSLYAVDQQRATRALQSSVTAAEREPSSIRQPPPEQAGFRRALELAAVGELDWVRAELTALSADAAAPELMFNAAVLYAKAGAVKLSSDAARVVFGRVPPRWPAGDWREAWRLAYPRPYAELVAKNAKSNAVAASLIYAVMREESAFDPEAVSPADAYGLMQLILPTARQMARPLGLPHDRVALKRPSVNIALGARVLANYADKFPRDPLLAVAAYNAGPGAAERWRKARPGTAFDLWVELIPYVETRRYIKRVLGTAAVYAIVYDEAPHDAALLLPRAVSN